MKKVFLALTFITQMSYAQERIGRSYMDVARDFAPSYMTYYTVDTSLFLTVELSFAEAVYEFNTDSICINTIVYPKTPKDLEFLIAQCNATCTRISSTEWESECFSGFCKGELIDQRYLMWTKLK